MISGSSENTPNYKIVGETGERRIYKIEVGNIPEDEIEEYLIKIKEQLKRPLPIIDSKTGQINIPFNPLPFDKTYYL